MIIAGTGGIMEVVLHECIRPVAILDRDVLLKDELTLNELRLLRFINTYFFASQMKEGEILEREIEIYPVFNSNEEREIRKVLRRDGLNFEDVMRFNVEARKVLFDGWMRLLKLREDIKDKNEFLFSFKEGQELGAEIKIEEGQTSLPERMRDEDLIQKLESYHIGRPSTYAYIINTLRKRYVEEEEEEKGERKMKPTETGRSVISYLRDKGSFVLDFDFTAKIEKDLDKIVDGKINKERVVLNVIQEIEKETGYKICKFPEDDMDNVDSKIIEQKTKNVKDSEFRKFPVLK